MPSLNIIKKRLLPATWLLAVLLALAPLGPHASALVLCFGADGHVAAEMQHAEDCLDVPIPSGGDVMCSSFKVESGPSAVAVLTVVHRISAPVRNQNPTRSAPPATYGPTALHRSVVLLI